MAIHSNWWLNLNGGALNLISNLYNLLNGSDDLSQLSFKVGFAAKKKKRREEKQNEL